MNQVQKVNINLKDNELFSGCFGDLQCALCSFNRLYNGVVDLAYASFHTSQGKQ